jgi:tetratricopeptide (TPR) repeat protein
MIMTLHPTLKILGVAATLGFLLIPSPVSAQFDAPIPGDLPQEEYGKYRDQHNQEGSKAQAVYNKSGVSDAGGYDLYPDEAEAVARYNADMTTSNREVVARIRFMYAAAAAAEFEKTGDGELLIKALNYAVSAVELSPRNAYYMFLPAYIYSLSAKSSPYASTMAEDYAKAALDLDPNYMEARMLLANLYLWRNSYDNALNEYEKLVRDNPRYARPDTLVCMCHAYHQDDQQVRGETFFRQLTNKYPDLSMIKLALAVMLKDAGKKDDSRKVLHDILEKKPAIPEVQDAARVGLRDWFGEEVRP